MARVVSLEPVDSKLNALLLSTLRPLDEVVVLPQAHLSSESNVAKNVVCRLNGSQGGLNPDIFSPNWFTGVSLVKIDNQKAIHLLSDKNSRVQYLEKLKNMIPSEMADVSLQVGPELEADEDGRDVNSWLCGFDSPSCCVGLYSALETKGPDGQSGMERVHKSFFLVCKAGAGLAGQTFHSRLTASLKGGQSLDDCLGEDGIPGAKALRRVANASRRNRARIITLAAEALGDFSVDTVGDTASTVGTFYRMAVPLIDVCCNALTKVEIAESEKLSIWKYSTCVDSTQSTGLLTSSNVSAGFVAFFTESGETKYSLKNDAFACIPFSSLRILNSRDAAFKAIEAHKQANIQKKAAHPDYDFVKQTFTWKAKAFGNGNCPNVEPSALWGTHKKEEFTSEWARELGISRLSPIRLHPEIVNLAAMEPGRLRIAMKAIEA